MNDNNLSPEDMIELIATCSACGWKKRVGDLIFSEAAEVFEGQCPACRKEDVVDLLSGATP